MNTPNFNAQYFNSLIDGLWNGSISEPAFIQEGLALGVNPARLQSILDDVREEDGLLHGEEVL